MVRGHSLERFHVSANIRERNIMNEQVNAPSDRLGQLMVKAGLSSSEQLAEALLHSKQIRLPFGRVLILCGVVTESNLRWAVQAQSMLRDGLITQEVAIEALRLASDASISFDQALERIAWQAPKGRSTNRLGELLVLAKVITAEELDAGLAGSLKTGLPLGRQLVLSKVISEALLTLSLNAQILVRDGKITKDQAALCLHSARYRLGETLTEAHLKRGSAEPAILLGELFVLAGIISQRTVTVALEVGLMDHKRIGQVLVEMGHITEQTLDVALELQKQVANSDLSARSAATALSRMHSGLLAAAC